MDELLTSIRQAIHERVTPDAPVSSHSAASTRPAARPTTGARGAGETVKTFPERPARGEDAAGSAAGSGRMKRTVVTSGREGFAGLLGGDVRLEEALARLNQPGWRRPAEASVASEAANAPEAAARPAPGPRLRPTIDDWTGGTGALKASPAERPAERKDERPKEGPKEDPMREHNGGGPRPAERPGRTSPRPGDGDLLSAQAATAAHSAFSRLNDATAPRSSGGDRSLDEMTRDCLRPLLKAWLDENLPDLVERLVREEIARVARTGR